LGCGLGPLRIYDYDAGTLIDTGPRCYHLMPPRSGPAWASIDPVNHRILGYGEDAWRSVGYTVPDERRHADVAADRSIRHGWR
jgi:hypothetical protein